MNVPRVADRVNAHRESRGDRPGSKQHRVLWAKSIEIARRFDDLALVARGRSLQAADG